MYHIYDGLHQDLSMQISRMVDDNYATLEYGNSAIVYFKHIWNSAKVLKQQSPQYDKLICYQLEPLVKNHWHNIDRIIGNLEGADEVWDYDLDNIEILKQYGIDAKFKPFRYSPLLKQVKNVENPEISCLFYGSLTDKRHKEIRAFIDAYSCAVDNAYTYLTSNIVWLYRTPYSFQDEMIARSKIVLNLNPYEGECRQQQSRIFYLLTNNKCVLSEKSNRNYYGNSIIEFEGYQDMGDKLLWLLKDDNWKNFTNWNGEITV